MRAHITLREFTGMPPVLTQPAQAEGCTVKSDSISLGLSIDADRITVFSQDYESELTTPNEADSKGDEDGKCGFAR